MVTLEKKCTLISMFDALAYQYPRILHKQGVSTPLDLVQLMLEGRGSGWDTCETSKSIKQKMIDGVGGYSMIFLATCYHLKINMCGKWLPISCRAKETLSNISDVSRPMLLNICEDGPHHVEFFPFPYVRTKRDQELYELYSEKSHVQIKEYEHKKWLEEEFKAREDWMAMDMGWGDEVYEACQADLSEYLKT